MWRGKRTALDIESAAAAAAANSVTRRPLLVANWKSHASKSFVDRFAELWRAPPSSVDVVICPPWGYLDRVAAALAAGQVRFGVQSTSAEPEGAFTGEHAAEMARDLGAEFAIVGHSERRLLFGETDALVARKFRAAGLASLTPILCVGESAAERRRGEAEAVVRAQLEDVIALCGAAALREAVIAYEPVWAIGTGETATPEQAQAMHSFIKSRLPDAGIAARVLYGGSVKADNAASLFGQADVDGALVGGASLDAASFCAICSAAAARLVC